MREEVTEVREEMRPAFGTGLVSPRPTIPTPRQTHTDVTPVVAENRDMMGPPRLPRASAGYSRPQAEPFAAP